MARSLTTEMQAVAIADVVRPFYLVEMEFSSPIYMWTGLGDLDAPSGDSYITNGDFVSGGTGWTSVTVGTGTATFTNNTAVLVADGFSNRASIQQSITTVSGQKYVVVVDHEQTSGIDTRIRIRDTVNNTNIIFEYYEQGLTYIVFTATSNVTQLQLRNQDVGTITINSAEIYLANTYIGVGDLLNLGNIKESAELRANGATITLTGVKTSLIAIARDEDYQGKKATIKLGAMNEEANVITTPVTLFTGFMDVMTIADSGELSTISVSVENKLIAFERKYVRRFTDNDQKIDYPNDNGFEYVASIQDKEIIWGRPTPVTAVPAHANREQVRDGR